MNLQDTKSELCEYEYKWLKIVHVISPPLGDCLQVFGIERDMQSSPSSSHSLYSMRFMPRHFLHVITFLDTMNQIAFSVLGKKLQKLIYNALKLNEILIYGVNLFIVKCGYCEKPDGFLTNVASILEKISGLFNCGGKIQSADGW